MTMSEKLPQATTTFGRLLTDGYIIICDDKPKSESAEIVKGIDSAVALARWLWEQEPRQEIGWPAESPKLIGCPHPDGKIECDECYGKGTTDCDHCGTGDIECGDCDGDGFNDCDCTYGVQQRDLQGHKAVSVGEFFDHDGQLVGIASIYLAMVNEHLGPITAAWYGPIASPGNMDGFVLIGERGRAVVMPYRRRAA